MTAPTTTEKPTEVAQEATDPPQFAHYVDKSKIVDATVFGFGLLTLCGIILYPGRANPEKLPVCEPCKRELDSIREFMQS